MGQVFRSAIPASTVHGTGAADAGREPDGKGEDLAAPAVVPVPGARLDERAEPFADPVFVLCNGRSGSPLLRGDEHDAAHTGPLRPASLSTFSIKPALGPRRAPRTVRRLCAAND